MSEIKVNTAFVVGASGGIGKSVVDRLLREGFGVLMFSRTEEKLQKAFKEMQDKYPMTILRAISGDVRNVDHINSAIDLALEVMGPIDLLVNAHGADPLIKPALSLTKDEFRHIMDVDVVGTFNTCQLVGKQMVKRRFGRIVNISSIHSRSSYPARCHYAAAKSAITGLTRALSLEFGEYNVTVNCLAPGQVGGDRTSRINRYQIKQILQRMPTGRLVDSGEIAEAIMFLYKSPSTNGETIFIDGGHTVSAWYLPYNLSHTNDN